MRRVWLLARNDLKLTARDRAAAFWMLIMPIAMMWLFGSIGGGGSNAPTRISLGIVNHDLGWLSVALIEELQDDAVRIRAMTPEAYAVAEDRVRTLIVPAGFTERALAGEQQVLRLDKEADSDPQYGFAMQVHITRAIVRTLGRLLEMDRAELADATGAAASGALERFQELGRQPQLVRLAVTTAGQGRAVPSGRAQSVPGNLTFLVMMMTLIYGGVFLTVEKASGMLRRQGTAPMSRRQIFLGKLLGRFLIASVQITILILAGRYLLGVSWGNSPLALLIVLVSFALAVAGLSTLLGAVLSTPAQASSVGWIVAMVLAALGGCWWPREIMPTWMQTLSYALPTAWAMEAFHALISFGQGIEAIWIPSLALIGFAVLFTLLGARTLRFD